MRNPEQVLNNLIVHSKVSDYKFERLYRNLFNEQMFYIAYQRIYAKPGNMTPGADGKTIDQMSTQRIERLIESLKNETYQPVPARRTYIPKKNGKLRPLGIPLRQCRPYSAEARRNVYSGLHHLASSTACSYSGLSSGSGFFNILLCSNTSIICVSATEAIT